MGESQDDEEKSSIQKKDKSSSDRSDDAGSVFLRIFGTHAAERPCGREGRERAAPVLHQHPVKARGQSMGYSKDIFCRNWLFYSRICQRTETGEWTEQ